MIRQRVLVTALLQLICVLEIYHTFVVSYYFCSVPNRDQFYYATNGDPDPEYSVRLKAEAAAPFRLFRTFVYGALGAAAGLGTLTTVPQLVKQLSDHTDTHTTLTNLAVNAGGLIITGFLLRSEANAESKLRRTFNSKQALSDNKLNSAQVLSREQQLIKLPVQIQVSEMNENVTRIVSLNSLLKQGNQRAVIVAGSESYVRDAVIAARLVDGSTFADSNIMIIPFVYSRTQLEEDASKKGFGASKSPLMGDAFFAQPAQVDVWQSILQGEVDAAARQQQRDPSRIWTQGIVLAMNTQGKVVRRGLGAPVWVDIVNLLAK